MVSNPLSSHEPNFSGIRHSPDLFDLREQALSAIRRRLLGPSKDLVNKFPELRLIGRFDIYVDGDIVLVHCNTYSSERNLRRRVASAGHPYPRLYTRDPLVTDVNLNLEDNSMNNGIGQCVVQNPVSPALRIGSNVTFAISNVKFELDQAKDVIYNYRVHIAFLMRFGSKINNASFSTYFENLLLSYIGFLRSTVG